MAQQHHQHGGPPPEPVAPMMATAGPVPSGAGWAFEFKWDGVRAVTGVGGDQLQVTSRNSNDVTVSYPELSVLTELLDGRQVLLDGEIVALDSSGVPRFDLLQERMHVKQPSDALINRVPVTYYPFDVLWLDNQSLMNEPYERRRQALDSLGLGKGSPRVQVPACHVEVDGPQLLEVARSHNLEGVVAKKLGSRYEPGRRSPAWVKTALVKTQEVIIGGWRAGQGRREGTVGALLLGAYDEHGRFIYLGDVGTGFTHAMLLKLQEQMTALARPSSPFESAVPRDRARGAHWVEPLLVGEVEYRTFTSDGRLRHAAWRGLRSDKSPADVRMP